MKVEFDVKYGKNVIDIPVPESALTELGGGGLVNLFNRKVTIYNDIADDGITDRHFDRFVVDKCSVQSGYVEKADGTVQNIVNSVSVITRDIAHYKTPLEYNRLPVDEKEKYFTARVDDFIVLAEVDDIVTTSQEFRALREKYKNNGILITAVNENIYGMAVDNITMTNA